MKHKSQRYIQPQNVRDAMVTIEKLFNQYRHAPLTNELLTYHQNLISRLSSDIYREAVKEEDPTQLKALAGMINAMQSWTKATMTGKPFQYKMKHFKLVSETTVQYRRKVIKNNTAGNHRATRH